MRIVIAAGIFPPDIGGPATYAEAFAEFCATQDIGVTVLCFADTAGIERSHAYAIHRIGRTGSKFFSYARYLLKLISLSRSADLVYAQGPVAGGLQAFLARFVTAKNYIVKVTGDYAWEQAVGKHGLDINIDRFQQAGIQLPFRIRLMRFTQRLVTAHARRVIVPSQYLRSLVRGWGVSRGRIEVMYNAVPEHKLQQQSARQAKLALHITGCAVISIGRLVPWKGFHTLIKAWPEIVKKVPDAHLYIIGSGPEHGSLQALIEEANLSQCITLTGKKSQEELSDWYQAADLFVLNSSYEGLSHVILEAMSYQVPCVVSSNGGNPELIQHERTGLLFRYDHKYEIIETVNRLLLHPAEAERYVTEATSWLQGHTQQHMLDSTLELFRGMQYRDIHRNDV